MSTVRIAIPANASIIKGSLRNLLDGSSAASIRHTAAMVEKIHEDILDNNDTHYSVDDFTLLLDQTRALVIFNRDYHIFRNSRGTDIDFIIVGYSESHSGYIARLYNVQEKEQVTATKVNNIRLDSVGSLLNSIWRELSSSYKGADSDAIETTGVSLLLLTLNGSSSTPLRIPIQRHLARALCHLTVQFTPQRRSSLESVALTSALSRRVSLSLCNAR